MSKTEISCQMSPETNNFEYWDQIYPPPPAPILHIQRTNFPKQDISGQKRKSRTFACAHGYYLLY